MPNVLLRFHPASIRSRGARASLGWWLAGLTAALVLIDAITGLLLVTRYHPTLASAYGDVQTIRSQMSTDLVREVHHWAASATIIAIWLHVMRALLTASYRSARHKSSGRFGWVVSVAMLALILLAAITGTMLPLDQSGFGVITGWFGGAMNAQAAGRWLLRFYLLHVAFIPLILAILIVAYLWRLRRDEDHADDVSVVADSSSPEWR